MNKTKLSDQYDSECFGEFTNYHDGYMFGLSFRQNLLWLCF